MAHEHGSEEKTEQPSQKRLRELREQGQLPISREFVVTIGLISVLLLLSFFSDMYIRHFQSMLSHVLLSLENHAELKLWDVLTQLLLRTVFIFLPLVLVGLVLVVFGHGLLGGIHFSWERIRPKFDFFKNGFLSGFFSMKSLFEIFKSALKMVILTCLFVFFIYSERAELYHILFSSFGTQLHDGFSLFYQCLILITMAFFIVVFFDIPFQIWDFFRQARMTRQELKDEWKETEGRPEVRAKIRQRQREMSSRRMMQAVQKSTAVIMNPTHFAVAVLYDRSKHKAPIVVAKGVDLIALQIRKTAEAAQVPVLEVPLLARALYHSTKMNREIPQGLYVAVAQVLAYLATLRVSVSKGASKFDPDKLEIPQEFHF